MNGFRNLSKRLLVFLLAFAMLVTIAPMAALAGETTGGEMAVVSENALAEKSAADGSKAVGEETAPAVTLLEDGSEIGMSEGQAYTVTFHTGLDTDAAYFDNDGTPADSVQLTFSEGAWIDAYDGTYNPVLLDDAHYEFRGWSRTQDSADTDGSVSVYDNMDLYAVWSKYILVTYDKGALESSYVWDDDWNRADSVTRKYTEGDFFYDDVSIAENDSSMYRFAGWFDEADRQYTDQDTLTGDLTVYAKWNGPQELVPGKDLAVSGYYDSFYYTFTPEESGVYELATSALESGTPALYVVDSEGNTQYEGNSSHYADDGNVTLQAFLQAGEPCYFQAGSSSDDAYSFHITLTQLELPELQTDSRVTVSSENGDEILYSFTPAEDGFYRVVSLTDSYAYDPVARLYDQTGSLLTEEAYGGEINNFVLEYELQAGQTYYFGFGENYHSEYNYEVQLTKMETAAVTFHINRPEKDAWFGEEKADTVTLQVPVGKDLASYYLPSLTLEDECTLRFHYWAETEEPEGWSELTVTGEMDVYAAWTELHKITLDGNGGYFNWNEEQTQVPIGIADGETFRSYDYIGGCSYIDDTRLFAGWSKSPTATVPDYYDNDATEEDLAEVSVLYAVWGEPVTVTYDAGTAYGGYFASWNEDLGETEHVATRSEQIAAGARYELPYVQNDNQLMQLEGWYTAAEGGEKIEDGMPVTGDTTVYAHWSEMQVIELEAGVETPVTEEDSAHYYKFTVPEDGNYLLTFTGGEDECIYIHAYNSELISQGSSGGWGESNRMLEELSEGDVFFFRFTAEDDGPVAGKVLMKKVNLRTVTFYANNGNAYYEVYNPDTDDYDHVDSETQRYPEETVIQSDSRITNVPYYDNDRFDFLGWSVNKNADQPDEEITVGTEDLEVWGVWKKRCAITFDVNGGEPFRFETDEETGEMTAVTTETYVSREGDTLPEMYAESADPFTAFAGWFDQKTGGTKYDSNSVVTDDITLYAHWTTLEKSTLEEETLVTAAGTDSVLYQFVPAEDGVYMFQSADGRNYNPEVILYDSANTKLAENLGAVNNNFCLAYELQGGQTYYYKITNSKDGVFRYPVKVSKVAAVTITFDTNCADATLKGSKEKTWQTKTAVGFTVRPSELAGFDQYPENMHFAGWAASPDAAAKDAVYSVNVKKDMTLYAVWEEEAEVTFDLNEETASFTYTDDETEPVSRTACNEILGRELADFPEIAIRPEGKRLAGWSVDPAAAEPDETITVTGPMTVYAVWTDSSSGETDRIHAAAIHAGETKTAYSASGKEVWYRFTPEEDGLYILESTERGEADPQVTLYDTDYNNNLTQLSYDDDGGEDWNFRVSYSMDAGTTYYYKVDARDKPFDFEVSLTKMETVALRLHLNRDDDKAWFLGDGMKTISIVWPKDVEQTYDNVGYEDDIYFAGWSTNPDAASGSTRIRISEDTEFYAIWADSIRITFNANRKDQQDAWYWSRDEAQDETRKVQTIIRSFRKNDGRLYNWYYEPEFSNPDLYFCGWSLDPAAAKPDEEILLDQDRTVYAVWSDRSYITYDANGGYFTDRGILYTQSYGDSEAMLNGYYPNTPVNPDPFKVFAGWATTPSGQPIDESTTKIGDLDTLYAVWQEGIKVTLHVDENGYFEEDGEKVHEIERYVLPDTYIDELDRVNSDTEYKRDYGRRAYTKGGEALPGDTKITEETDLWVIWTEMVKVTFDTGEGSIEGESSKVIWKPKGQTIYLAQFVQASGNDPAKVFAGWSTEGADGAIIRELEVTKDTTLYAVYRAGYEVTLAAPEAGTGYVYARVNGAYYDSGEDGTFHFLWPQDVAYEDMDLGMYEVKEGLLFTGFSTTADGKNPIGISWTPSKAETLYPVLVEGFHVEFYARQGHFESGEMLPGTDSWSYKFIDVLKENAIGEVEEPIAPEGWRFAGWQKSGAKEGDPLMTSAEVQAIVPTSYLWFGACYEEYTGPVALTGLAFAQDTATLKEGGSSVLKAVRTPSNANGTISWSSDNTAVATVDQAGNVTAVSAGTAVITACADEDSSIKATCTVTVTHALSKVEAAAATCGKEGNISYWKCDACGKLFKDEAGTEEIAEAETVIARLAHTPAAAVTENVTAATCEEAGKHDEVVYCSVCGEELSRDTKVDAATGHQWDEGVVTKEATCEEDGVKTFTCAVCHKTHTEAITAPGHQWSEWQVTTPATEEQEGEETRTCSVCHKVETRTIPMLSHEHSLTEVAAKAATCTEPGNIRYWRCDTCGGIFEDAAGTQQIEEEKTVVAALGHKWGTPVYTWADDHSSVTAKRICEHDASHAETETNSSIVTAVTRQPSCEVKGETTYTSGSFENSAFTAQSAAVENIEATGHKWGTPVWIWADDRSSASAVFTCDSCKKTETVKAEVAEAITQPATVEAEGVKTYTAMLTFGGTKFEDSKTEVIPKKAAVQEITPQVKLSKASFVYNGKVQKPAVTVKNGNEVLPADSYDVQFQGGCLNAGSYKVTVTMKDGSSYSGSGQASFTITKAANPLLVKAVNKTVKFAKVKKKAQTVKGTAKITRAGKGAVTYKIASVKKAKFKKNFTIDKKGNIKVKKGTKKGKYTLQIAVKAAGDGNYLAATKKINVKITVK